MTFNNKSKYSRGKNMHFYLSYISYHDQSRKQGGKNSVYYLPVPRKDKAAWNSVSADLKKSNFNCQGIILFSLWKEEDWSNSPDFRPDNAYNFLQSYAWVWASNGFRQRQNLEDIALFCKNSLIEMLSSLFHRRGRLSIRNLLLGNQAFLMR